MGIHTPIIAEKAAPAEFFGAQVMLAPFVGVRLKPVRNELGYIADRTSWVDIFAPGIAYIDAYVRGLTEDGVEICRFGGFSEFIRFDQIDLIRVRHETRRDEVLNFRRAA